MYTLFIATAFGQMFHQSFTQIFANFPGSHLTGRVFAEESVAAGMCTGYIYIQCTIDNISFELKF